MWQHHVAREYERRKLTGTLEDLHAESHEAVGTMPRETDRGCLTIMLKGQTNLLTIIT